MSRSTERHIQSRLFQIWSSDRISPLICGLLLIQFIDAQTLMISRSFHERVARFPSSGYAAMDYRGSKRSRVCSLCLTGDSFFLFLPIPIGTILFLLHFIFLDAFYLSLFHQNETNLPLGMNLRFQHRYIQNPIPRPRYSVLHRTGS